MKKLVPLFLILFAACNSPSNSPIPANLSNGPTLPVVTGANVMSMTVNGSECAAGSYVNKPCVSVTICEPGTSVCQTVSDILLDTGSYGLRVFKSALGSVALPAVASGAGALAECVQFGDGSSDWGPVAMADVQLGGEPQVQMPIHVIDSTFFAGDFSCATPDVSPSQAGFNGVLGVGLFAQDCGSECVTNAANGIYFSCSGSACTGTTAALASQVQNPVSAQAIDNNGVIVELPTVPAAGASSAQGYVILGIGTETNNAPPTGSSAVNAFTANATTGDFTTSYNSATDSSFLDSGSNALFFPPGSPATLPDCGPTDVSFVGWFCPASASTLTATNIPASGTTQSLVTFQIESAITLLSGKNKVFNDIGATSSNGSLTGTFDWGLPFYLGRNVYVGIEGKTSSLGSGPYWAY